MQDNLKKKYCITTEELNEGVDILAHQLNEISNINVLLALADLLTNGDIDIKEIKQ